MTAMEVLTKLVVGMSRFGDHLLRRKVSGIIVAALAFACGAGLAYALRRGPAAGPRPAPHVSTPTVAAPAPPPAVDCVPADEDEFGDSPELQAWKHRHSGTPLPLD